MSQMSNYLENALINASLRATAYTAPTKVYLALYTTDPTDLDTGVEVSGGSYARQEIAFNAPTSGETINSGNVSFPTATTDWGTVTHIGIRDALTGGNLLYHARLNTERNILTNDAISFLAGQISVALD